MLNKIILLKINIIIITRITVTDPHAVTDPRYCD